MSRRAINIPIELYDQLRHHCYAKLDEDIGSFVDRAIETALANPAVSREIVEYLRADRTN